LIENEKKQWIKRNKNLKEELTKNIGKMNFMDIKKKWLNEYEI
jgi:hypothetical protein